MSILLHLSQPNVTIVNSNINSFLSKLRRASVENLMERQRPQVIEKNATILLSHDINHELPPSTSTVILPVKIFLDKLDLVLMPEATTLWTLFCSSYTLVPLLREKILEKELKPSQVINPSFFTLSFECEEICYTDALSNLPRCIYLGNANLEKLKDPAILMGGNPASSSAINMPPSFSFPPPLLPMQPIFSAPRNPIDDCIQRQQGKRFQRSPSNRTYESISSIGHYGDTSVPPTSSRRPLNSSRQEITTSSVPNPMSTTARTVEQSVEERADDLLRTVEDFISSHSVPSPVLENMMRRIRSLSSSSPAIQRVEETDDEDNLGLENLALNPVNDRSNGPPAHNTRSRVRGENEEANVERTLDEY